MKKTLTWIGIAIVVLVVVGLLWSAWRIKAPVAPVVSPTDRNPAVKTYPACAPDQIAFRLGKKECECGGRFEFWDDGNTYCRDFLKD